MRQRLAETLRYIVAQRLAPKIGGGRQLVMEIMGSNLRTREAILLGESEERTFYDITAASATYGWQTFDQSILASFKDGTIDEETAMAYASRKPVVMRGVDQHKHGLNQGQEADSGLRMAAINGGTPELAVLSAAAAAVPADGETLSVFCSYLFSCHVERHCASRFPPPRRPRLARTTRKTGSAARIVPRWSAATSRVISNISPASCAASATRCITRAGHQAAIQRLAARSYHMTVLLENLEGCALADNALLAASDADADGRAARDIRRHALPVVRDGRRDERVCAGAWIISSVIRTSGSLRRWWSRRSRNTTRATAFSRRVAEGGVKSCASGLRCTPFSCGLSVPFVGRPCRLPLDGSRSGRSHTQRTQRSPRGEGG